jgi:hypothetical protein
MTDPTVATATLTLLDLMHLLDASQHCEESDGYVHCGLCYGGGWGEATHDTDCVWLRLMREHFPLDFRTTTK